MKNINRLLSEIFSIPEQRITDDLLFSDLDSFKMIFFYSQLEKECKVKFTLKDMAEVNTLGDLKAVIKQRGMR